jgi:murein DD-endopeptidase MepM/ murein hydrolase activator NlpD
MRRFERRRVAQLRRLATAVGLSFALGALVDVGLTWRLHELDRGAGPGMVAAADPEPAHDPAQPQPVVRPGEGSVLPAVGTTGAVAHGAAVDELRSRDLEMPVEGMDDDDLRDTFADSRGRARAHEALDIMAPRNTVVRAVEDGLIAKLFNSKGGGGLTIYQFDPSSTYCYYYAHLDRYADGLREGARVRRGQTIGYAGSTGTASPNAPHLHFAIFQLTSDRVWWKGEPINPYPVFK